MNRYALFVCFLAVIVLSTSPAMAQSKAAPLFDKLKSLVGEWGGETPEGPPGGITYEIFSGGSALLETLEPGGDHANMVTVYHLDGDKLMMTHYCSAQNQPRLRAKPVAGEINKIDFSFVDATNLSDPSDGHMHGLVLSFLDDDHFTQEWTFLEDGKETPLKIEFERKK